MAIGVLIKRVTKHGEDAKVLLPHIVEIRSLAVRQPGYISGETFFNLDRTDECLVIARWTTRDLRVSSFTVKFLELMMTL